MAFLAVFTLSLGIALTTTLFSILQGTLLRPLPLDGAERLVAIERYEIKSSAGGEMRYRDYRGLRQRQKSFAGVAAFSMLMATVTPDTVLTSDTVLTPDGDGLEGGATEVYIAAEVSPNLFDLVGVRPLMGRGLRDDAPTPEAVVSEAVWRRQLGADRSVLGRRVWVNEVPRTIVGVMPEGFAFPYRQEIWIDLRADEAAHSPVSVVGLLRPGVSIQQANAEMASLTQGLREESPEALRGIDHRSRSYVAAHTDARLLAALPPMIAAGVGILLIVSVNVGNLLLARAVRRRRDLAVCTALGATRGHRIVESLSESLALALLASLPGLFLAGAGIGLYNRVMAPSDALRAFWIDVRLDGASVLFVLGVCLLTSLMAGLVPALRASSVSVGEILRTGAGGVSGRGRGRLRGTFVVAEVALSCGLLVVCALLVRSVVNLRTFDPGFSAEGVITARMALVRPEQDPSSAIRFHENLEQRLRGLPGVRRVAFASSIPTQGSMWREVESETREMSDPARVRWIVVSPSFFATLGVDHLAGRDFDSRDSAESAPVVIVNRSFAARLLAAGPVGQRIRFATFDQPADWKTVVGVVDDYEMGRVDDGGDPAAIYVPLAQAANPSMYVALQVEGEPLSLTRSLRREVAAVDPFAACFDIRTLEEVLARRRWVYDSMSSLFLVLGIVALVLATVGFYGVLSVAVAERTREYGLRSALGASARDLRQMVVGAGLVQLVLGLVLGLGLALVSVRMLSSLLFQVDPWDPVIYLLVSSILLGCGLLACLRPAERAARVDPMTALRSS